MSGRRLRSRAAANQPPSYAPTASSTRPRRGNTNNSASSAFIERSSPEETRQSMNLTVKAPPNKLRKATSGTAKTAVTSRNIVSGTRSSRNSRAILEVDSDEEEEEEEEEGDEPEDMDVDDEEDEEDPDAEGEEDDEDDVDVDAEGEDDDEEMVDVAPAPRITVSKPANSGRRRGSNINVTPAPDITSVEAKEMAMADEEEDEELSELSEEEAEEEEEDEEEEGGDEDAEGEEDEEMAEQENDDDDDELDSDDETPQSMSRSHTPDLSKMTRRQRAMVIEGEEDGLMALSNEAQKKKHLTAEEHAMRRAEMARRRKNLSEKRNEEEKMDTINRLLKKQPPKRGRRAIADITESGLEDELEQERANPIYIRYTQNAKGSSIAIPDEWLVAPVGSLFAENSISKSQSRPFGGRMVEEVA